MVIFRKLHRNLISFHRKNQFFRWINGIVIFSSVIILTGCKIDSRYEVFLSDIFEVMADEKKVVEVNSTLHIEMPNIEKCNENLEKITAIIVKYYSVIATPECQGRGLESFMAFKTKSPLFNGKRPELPNNAVAGLAVMAQENQRATLFAMLDKRRLTSLQAEMAKLSPSKIDINDIILDINNDGKEIYQVNGAAAFINGEPKQIVDIMAERRAKIELKPSNVMTADLIKIGYSPVLTVSIKK